jgi:hypothetical protein
MSDLEHFGSHQQNSERAKGGEETKRSPLKNEAMLRDPDL